MRIIDWSSDVCSSDLPELVQALTAVLQPLVGQTIAYLVAADGRSVELADPDAIGARIAARTEALAADASRPEAKAIAALLRALPPARRAELATADIRALVAPASPEDRKSTRLHPSH